MAGVEAWRRMGERLAENRGSAGLDCPEETLDRARRTLLSKRSHSLVMPVLLPGKVPCAELVTPLTGATDLISFHTNPSVSYRGCPRLSRSPRLYF